MASTKPLIAFYGATGGSANAALVPALNAGFDCTALARTPSKLTSMLLAKGVSQASIDTHLTISKGDVLSVELCKGPLILNGRPADIIVSGIGIVNMREAFSEIRLCGDAVSNILTALKQLQLRTKPLFVALSTTGITSGPRDVPLLFLPFYHYLLAKPHQDKKRMEDVVIEHAKSSDSAISGYTLVRMALLMNNKPVGMSKIRAGSEEKPAVGYTIGRDDAGAWIFENIINGDESKLIGKKPSIAY